MALVVTGAIVLCFYSSFRYPKTETGVLAKRGSTGATIGQTYRGDQTLPYRTPGGGRLTRWTTPVREIRAVTYFAWALVVIVSSTAIGLLLPGYHFLSDVLAGYLVGATWLIAGVLFVRHRETRFVDVKAVRPV